MSFLHPHEILESEFVPFFTGRAYIEENKNVAGVMGHMNTVSLSQIVHLLVYQLKLICLTNWIINIKRDFIKKGP